MDRSCLPFPCSAIRTSTTFWPTPSKAIRKQHLRFTRHLRHHSGRRSRKRLFGCRHHRPFSFPRLPDIHPLHGQEHAQGGQGDPTSNFLDDAGFWTRTVVKSQPFIVIAIIVVSVTLLQQTYYGLMSVGMSTGYQPEQPIAFSHKVHAGENQVDCNYCHSSARHSASSGIPSTNVCMNCHMYIDGSEITDERGNLKYDGERSPEIAKIYAAIGWDPEERAYIEDYEQQAVKWVRIHNLPDLAYFNHAQHVNAGQVECQTCHGPIEEMEEVYQHSDLSMGWCINCHRETEVQVETNGYYAGLHEQLKEKYGDEPITVEKIGGLNAASATIDPQLNRSLKTMAEQKQYWKGMAELDECFHRRAGQERVPGRDSHGRIPGRCTIPRERIHLASRLSEVPWVLHSCCYHGRL